MLSCDEPSSLGQGIWEDGRVSLGVSKTAVLFEPMKIVVGKLCRKNTIFEGVLLAVLGIKV